MLIHQALTYGSPEELVAALGPFVRDGLEREEQVFTATKAANLDALREELGDDAQRIDLIDTNEWVLRPYERLQAIRRRVAALPEGTALRAAGEPLWEGSDAVRREWARQESIINLALADAPLRFVCLYDGGALPDEVLEHAARTHPEHLRGTAAVPCLSFVPPDEFSPGTAPDPPESAVDLPLAGREFRRELAERALDAGLAPQPAEDFVTAANELLTNAIQHGRPPVWAQLWSGAGELVCRVTDSGDGIADPLAGWLPPERTSSTGWGLPLARQLSDALEVVVTESGTTAHVHASLTRR